MDWAKSWASILYFAFLLSAFYSNSAEEVLLEEFPLPLVQGRSHFQGADGVDFDFMGEPGNTYCLISDAILHINMLLGGYSEVETSSPTGGFEEAQTWVRGLGVISGEHRIELYARKNIVKGENEGLLDSVVLDGFSRQLVHGRALHTADGTLSLEFSQREGDGQQQMNAYTLKADYGDTQRLDVLIKVQAAVPEAARGDVSVIYLSVEVLEAPLLHGGDPHGVLGQTFRKKEHKQNFTYTSQWNGRLRAAQVAGPHGEGYLDGTMSDYATSGLLAPDCKFSRFTGAQHSAQNTRLAKAEAFPERGTSVEDEQQDESQVHHGAASGGQALNSPRQDDKQMTVDMMDVKRGEDELLADRQAEQLLEEGVEGEKDEGNQNDPMKQEATARVEGPDNEGEEEKDLQVLEENMQELMRWEVVNEVYKRSNQQQEEPLEEEEGEVTVSASASEVFEEEISETLGVPKVVELQPNDTVEQTGNAVTGKTGLRE